MKRRFDHRSYDRNLSNLNCDHNCDGQIFVSFVFPQFTPSLYSFLYTIQEIKQQFFSYPAVSCVNDLIPFSDISWRCGNCCWLIVDENKLRLSFSSRDLENFKYSLLGREI